MNIAAFLSYIIITSVTPGPSNLLMMNEARRYGFKGAWKFNSGILTGFALLGIVSGLFTAGLYQWIPVIEPYFKAAGALYLVYLAGKIGFPKAGSSQASELESSFYTGLLFQLINVKSILFFLTVMSVFIMPAAQSVSIMIFYTAVTIVLGWTALLLWSMFGSLLKNVWHRYDRIFRVVMAALLIYAASAILF